MELLLYALDTYLRTKIILLWIASNKQHVELFVLPKLLNLNDATIAFHDKKLG